jgi:squalene-hopene/tetraprenyl-beta-curcumene cyclase
VTQVFIDKDIAGSTVDGAIAKAAAALLALQKPDGHWVFELEADATIPAEYILLRQYLGEPDDRVL